MTELDRALAHPYLAALARAIRQHSARTEPPAREARRAAVALVHRVVDDEVQLLLVKRATYPGDPWSGHVALPGGRREPGDASLEDTAVRETQEETSLDLRTRGAVLGALDEMYPRIPVLPPMIITPFVAVVAGSGDLRLSPELADAFWVPLLALRDPTARREVELVVAGAPRTVPSFQHSGYTVWGITHRILDQYLSVAPGL